MNILKNARLKTFAAALVLSAAACAGWRVDVLAAANGKEKPLFALPAANGYRFTTGYTHSVELTPVEDEYSITGGAGWNWQERVKSSNAGMPSIAPERGKYFNTEEWLIFQGGGTPWERFHLRVGNERFGRNWISLPPYGRADLYKIIPGGRLVFTVSQKPLAAARAEGLGVLADR